MERFRSTERQLILELKLEHSIGGATMLNLTTTLNTLRQLLMLQPVEIYDFYFGSQTEEDDYTVHFVNFYKQMKFFGYVSQDQVTYLPLGIKREGIQRTSHGEIEKVSFTVDNVNKAMSSYAAQYDFRNKRVIARLVFRDQLSNAEDALVVFDGLIQSVSFEQKKKSRSVIIEAMPQIGSLDIISGWPYEVPCNAKFGDIYCKVDKNLSSNKKSGTATGGTTSTLIDSSGLTHANDYWNYGYVEMTSGNNQGQKRKIIDFISSTHTAYLDYQLPHAISAGDTYTIYRGCDKTLPMCTNTYANDANYHGFHTIPLENK